MTVKELIDQLKMMPEDMMVVVPGYEGGYDNIALRSDSLVLDANWDGKEKHHWYSGRHENYFENDDNTVQPIACVIVGRGT